MLNPVISVLPVLDTRYTRKTRVTANVDVQCSPVLQYNVLAVVERVPTHMSVTHKTHVFRTWHSGRHRHGLAVGIGLGQAGEEPLAGQLEGQRGACVRRLSGAALY